MVGFLRSGALLAGVVFAGLAWTGQVQAVESGTYTFRT